MLQLISKPRADPLTHASTHPCKSNPATNPVESHINDSCPYATRRINPSVCMWCVCDCVTSFWLARVNYLTIHTVISYESVSLAIDFVLWISPKCIAAFCSLNRFPLIALRQWYMAVFIEVMSALPSSLFTNIRSPRSHGWLRRATVYFSKQTASTQSPKNITTPQWYKDQINTTFLCANLVSIIHLTTVHNTDFDRQSSNI